MLLTFNIRCCIAKTSIKELVNWNNMMSKPLSPPEATHSFDIKPSAPRKMFTVAQKVHMLDMLQKGTSYAFVGRMYGINESSVHSIEKEERQIRAKAAFKKTRKRFQSPRRRNMVKMEVALISWIELSRKNNITLTGKKICAQAKSIYKSLAKIHTATESTPLNANKFRASTDWYRKFRKRHGLDDLIYGNNYSLDFPDSLEPITETIKVEPDEMHPQDVHLEPQAVVNGEKEEAGLPLDRLITIVTLTKEIQRMAQTWDPQEKRASKFASAIQEALLVYKPLLANEKSIHLSAEDFFS